MATVIERLIVHGGVAPGGSSNLPRSQLTRQSNRKQIPRDKPDHPLKTMSQVPETTEMPKDGFLVPGTYNAAFHSTTYKYGRCHGDDTRKWQKPDFVLCGRGVQEPFGVKIASTENKPLRAGRYKITPRELYRVSHGISSKYSNEYTTFGHATHACFEPNSNYDSEVVARSAQPRKSEKNTKDSRSAASASFGLIPPSTAPASNSRASDPSRSAALSSLELTGQKFPGYTSEEFHLYDSHILDDSCFPYLRSPTRRTRLPRFSTNSSFGYVDKSQGLQNCLTIKGGRCVSNADGHKTNNSGGESRKLASKSANTEMRRYEFSNVGSYLAFNKQTPPPVPVARPRFAHIPRGMITLPEPWAETVLLKLMGDMQQNKSRMSSAKYSDLAFHGDLDEFFVIRCPTSPDKHSRLHTGLMSPAERLTGSQSVKSFVHAKTEDKIDEEDEERILVTDRLHTEGRPSDGDSSVDPTDTERSNNIMEPKHENLDSGKSTPKINGKPEPRIQLDNKNVEDKTRDTGDTVDGEQIDDRLISEP